MKQHTHDKGYRDLFSNVAMLRQLLESFINESWVKDIDFSRASLFNTTVISPMYQKTESDVIWRLPLKTGQEVFVYLLLEFQSTVDKFMAFRMLQYVIQLYHSLKKQQPGLLKLPPVFPIVLYNGEQAWTAPTQFAELIYPPISGSYIPRFEYFKIAENEFKREELMRFKNLVGALFLLETSSTEDYPSTIQEVVGILERQDPELCKEFTRWLWHTFSQNPPSELDDLQNIKEVSTMLQAELQREREAVYHKGKLDGKQEGKKEGKKETASKLKARGMALQEIAEVTGLSIETIKSL